MAFGISPDTLALRPSTVLQNIIQEKQLAAREKERATSERLALKRISQTGAAAAEQARQFGVSQESAQKRFDVGRTLDEREKITADIAQAQEARAVAGEQRDIAGEQAIGKWGQPTGQPTVEPVIAPSKTYTPKESIAPAFKANPDLQVGFQKLYDATKKPTISQEAGIKNRAKSEIIAENPNVKSLRTLQRKAKVRAAKYQREAETNRKNAVTTLFNTEQDLKAKLQPAKLTYAQKTKIKAIKTNLKQGSYLSKDVLRGKLKTNKIESLNDAIGYITFKGESPDKFTKELEKYARNEYNKLRASGVSVEEARKRLGL